MTLGLLAKDGEHSSDRVFEAGLREESLHGLHGLHSIVNRDYVMLNKCINMRE